MMQDVNLYLVFLFLPFFIYFIIKLIGQLVLKNKTKEVIVENSHGKKEIYYYNSKNEEIFDKDIRKAINFEILVIDFFKKMFEKNTSIELSYNDVFDLSLSKNGKTIFIEIKMIVNNRSFWSIKKGVSKLKPEDYLFVFTDIEVGEDIKRSFLDINPNVKFFDSKILKNQREVNSIKNFIQSYLEN